MGTESLLERDRLVSAQQRMITCPLTDLWNYIKAGVELVKKAGKRGSGPEPQNTFETLQL